MSRFSEPDIRTVFNCVVWTVLTKLTSSRVKHSFFNQCQIGTDVFRSSIGSSAAFYCFASKNMTYYLYIWKKACVNSSAKYNHTCYKLACSAYLKASTENTPPPLRDNCCSAEESLLCNILNVFFFPLLLQWLPCLYTVNKFCRQIKSDVQHVMSNDKLSLNLSAVQRGAIGCLTLTSQNFLIRQPDSRCLVPAISEKCPEWKLCKQTRPTSSFRYQGRARLMWC